MNANKWIFICRIITIISAVLWLVFMLLLTTSDPFSWGDSAWSALKIATYALSAGIFLPPVIVACIRYNERDKRIKKLEAEVERLKRINR